MVQKYFCILNQSKRWTTAAKANSFQQILDPEEASRLACGQASVKLQPRWQLGRYGNFLFFIFFWRISTKNKIFILKVPSPWKPMVDSWSSNPFLPKNPRLEFVQFNFICPPPKLGDLVWPWKALRQDMNACFVWDAKTYMLTGTTRNFTNLKFPVENISR